MSQLSKLDSSRIITVQSTVEPNTEALLAARKVIQQQADIQSLLEGSTEAGPLADQLHQKLRAHMTDTPELWDICVYLADERVQVGGSNLLIDQATGKALIRITEKDLYYPPAQRREGSDKLAASLPALNPYLESALIQRSHQSGVEKAELEKLRSRIPMSELELLKNRNLNYLAVVTKSGREGIVQRLQGQLEQLGWDGPPPLFPVCRFEAPPDPNGDWLYDVISCEARVSTPLPDKLALNLRYQHTEAVTAKAKAQLTRNLAEQVVERVSRGTQPIKMELDQAPVGFWVADPNSTIQLRATKKGTVFTAGHRVAFFAPDAVVYVALNHTECKGREILSRWEVWAKQQFQVWIDPKHIILYDLVGITPTGIEVV